MEDLHLSLSLSLSHTKIVIITIIFCRHGFFLTSSLVRQANTSRWWKEAVEVEREGIELLIPAVSFKCPELNPPWHPPVSGAVLIVKCVV